MKNNCLVVGVRRSLRKIGGKDEPKGRADISGLRINRLLATRFLPSAP